jgi:3-hydroxyacyl-CoA dehydrogenase
MTETVSVTRDGEIAIVTIDNPPVNAMGHVVREPLAAALKALGADDATAGIVIACAGRTFVAGADITEFGKPPRPPHLREIIAILEAIDKPTVAAIHGTALGGGLELALGCHFRVADRAAKLGLPEVKLGILPGAGGTVRLPRLVGPLKALAMIVTGAPIPAEDALESGLVDLIAEGDLRQAAIAFLRERLASGDRPVLVRERVGKLAVDPAAVDAAAADLFKKARGLEAPAACAEAVRNAMALSFEEALAAERALFEKLVAGDQSKAQRHLFFAEREAAKIPGIGKHVKPREVARVAVIGAGTMGGGIAMAFANADIPVTVLEMTEEALKKGLGTVERNYAASVSRGSLDEGTKARRVALIKGTTDHADLADADLIVEAAFEDMAVKREIFGRLAQIAKPGAVLATNTSYLDVDEIAAASGRAGDVLGMHFFSPANVMKLLEIVRGKETAPEALATAVAVAKRIAKVPVVVGVCHGFVGNRMLRARGAENESLLLEGASPEQVDEVFVNFGWPMGPFQMADLAGLDIGWRTRKARGETAAIADALCEAGRFGQKTGRGYYRYAEGSRTALPDPEVAELIAAKARELGIERRPVSADEILERTHLPLVNEGAKILAEGIAARASDIDIVWVNGYGFPVGKGGPMFWATLQGLDKIVERLEYWHGRTGKAVFEPAPLLRRAAADGGFLGND